MLLYFIWIQLVMLKAKFFIALKSKFPLFDDLSLPTDLSIVRVILFEI
jgi:hypothetical protein